MIEGTVKNCVLFRDVVVEKGAEISNCIIMEGGRILSDASLRYVITDRNVVVRDGPHHDGDTRIIRLRSRKMLRCDIFSSNPQRIRKNKMIRPEMFVKNPYVVANKNLV